MKYLALAVLCLAILKPVLAQQTEFCEVTLMSHDRYDSIPIPDMEFVIRDTVKDFSFAIAADSSGIAKLKLPRNHTFEVYSRDPIADDYDFYYDSRIYVLETDSDTKKCNIQTDMACIYITVRLPGFYFKKGSSELTDQMKHELDSFASVMNRYKRLLFEVQGHTRAQGSPEANFDLSLKRAETVADYLQSRSVGRQNVYTPQAFGDYRLVNDCRAKSKRRCTEEEHQMNDRVMLHLAGRVR
jgi:outer membrane protein OmpA-like peptidoglycan-associated protein